MLKDCFASLAASQRYCLNFWFKQKIRRQHCKEVMEQGKNSGSTSTCHNRQRHSQFLHRVVCEALLATIEVPPAGLLSPYQLASGDLS